MTTGGRRTAAGRLNRAGRRLTRSTAAIAAQPGGRQPVDSHDRRPPFPVGYTPGMKTAISIPDDVYAEVERLARRLNRSRSRLYADAAREYVARHDPDAVTDA